MLGGHDFQAVRKFTWLDKGKQLYSGDFLSQSIIKTFVVDFFTLLYVLTIVDHDSGSRLVHLNFTEWVLDT